MAPEQAEGAKVDARSDLYGLGVVLYRMCTGQLPSVGRYPQSRGFFSQQDRILSASEVNPDVPHELSDLITSLLSPDPARRPASAVEVANRLAAREGSPPQAVGAERAARSIPAKAWYRTAIVVAGLLAAICLAFVLGRFGVSPAVNHREGPPPADSSVSRTRSSADEGGPDDALLKEVSARVAKDRDRLPAGLAHLCDRAQAFYGASLKSSRDGDRQRGEELAVAADDAARGIGHIVRAHLSNEADLPPPELDGPPPRGRKKGPPPGPPPGEQPSHLAYHELELAKDQLNDIGAAGNDPFLDAAREAYANARKAYAAGEYKKATEFAIGAGMLLHVGEHLWRARWEGDGARPGGPPRPPEGGRRGRPPPPRGDGPPERRGPPPLPPED
jgi:hypothetical protein